MTGRIVQISISPGGIPKRSVSESFLAPLGFQGNGVVHRHIHGGPEKALLIMLAEVIEDLAARGYPVNFGAMGENLTVRGLDRMQMRSGQQYRAGEAMVELTTVRGPCATLDVYGPRIKEEIFDAAVKAGDFSSPRWGMSGFYARVVRPGMVRTNDIISLVADLA